MLWSCGNSQPAEWHDEGSYRWRELSVSRRGGPGFTQLRPSRTRIRFINEASQDRTLLNRHLTHGSGVALGDVDGDGLVDIYLANIEGPNALYRNLGDWRFEDIAERAGVTLSDRASTGVVLADVDGDRDLDLFTTSLGGPNALFLNDGRGAFTELREAGMGSDRGSTTMALADVDGDGDLDLYITNYKVTNALDLFAPQERAFDAVVQQTGDGEYLIRPEFEEHYRVTVRQDLGIVVRTQRADPDWYLMNDGTGRFQQVSFTGGRFLDETGSALEIEPDYFGLAARFYDVDGDGDPDLYVCNDFEDPDLFWLNDGTGTFQAAPSLAIRTTSNAGMAVDFADIDRDGDVDFFEVDMLSRDPRLRKTQRPTHTPLPKGIGVIDDRPQMQRNTLFVNRGDATFAQVSYLAGVAASDWSWATMFLDVDLDGYEDLLIANGHVWDVMDADLQLRLSSSPSGPNWREERLLFPDLRTRNVAFRNRGDLTFEEMGDEWGFATEEDISHGMAAGDLDGDGDQDVVINRYGSPAAVFRNNASAQRIAVRLLGAAPNTQGIGAKIRVSGVLGMEQEKEVTLGGLYLSSSDPAYTFAAASGEGITIVVDWRSGKRSVVREARPSRLYEIREEGAGAAESTEVPDAAFFADVSDQLAHIHHEEPFDDFGTQPLLPNELSRLGPGVSWYDFDRDGDEDLFITSGRGGPLVLYRNDRGNLRRVDGSFDAAELDQTSVLGFPSTEGSSVLLGQMSYEAATARNALSAASVLRLALDVTQRDQIRARVTESVPGDTSSVGPLALADYDGDGDLDLFVGGRTIPTAYPVPASSRLYRNQGGVLERDDTNSSTFSKVGLVSAAVFSDVDLDGDPDLLLALDWGSVMLFVNDDGRFIDQTAAAGLGATLSRWNGITTGDIDEDGRPDIIATSWGRNTGYRPTVQRPLFLYYGDFDANGRVDLLESYFDRSSGAWVPLASFTRVRAAIPSVTGRISSYAEYAKADLTSLLGASFDAVPRLEVRTFDHTVFLNRGTRFEAVPLPLEAQFAPAFHASVADFDGDGHDDVFISQNFFPTERDTPRHDAGRGLWLQGDGTGRLQAVSGQVTGVKVYGDQRGAAVADYDADGRVDLVVSQNGAQTKLYRNVRAKRGLRVRLLGRPENPDAIGAVVRVRYADGFGPAREVHAGSGYWSQDGAVQVMGLRAEPQAVWVRWPGGEETEVPVEAGTRELVIRR